MKTDPEQEDLTEEEMAGPFSYSRKKNPEPVALQVQK